MTRILRAGCIVACIMLISCATSHEPGPMSREQMNQHTSLACAVTVNLIKLHESSQDLTLRWEITNVSPLPVRVPFATEIPNGISPRGFPMNMVGPDDTL